MNNSFNVFIALLKREVLEHKNLWRVPMVLLVIAVLLRLSFSFGNLAIDYDFSQIKPLDETLDSVLDSAVFKTLAFVNFFVIVVMFLVAIFYALSCLYEERRDDSVLFWRSLPISDWMTILSKLFIPLVVIPVVILLCQAINALVFLGANAGEYMPYFLGFAAELTKKNVWTLLPVISWCMLCSAIVKRNPFLIAFITPILLMLIDYLFFNGAVSDFFVINRFTSANQFSTFSLFVGVIFSLACIAIALFKRTQKI